MKPSRVFSAPLLCLLGIILSAGFSQNATAQRAVTNVTTISKIFSTWDYTSAGGYGRNCGYVLTGGDAGYPAGTEAGLVRPFRAAPGLVPLGRGR